MIGNNNWVEGPVHITHKKAHSQPIISVTAYQPPTFFTSSQDTTLRLWDIRTHSSVKLFRHPSLHSLTNCDHDGKWGLFVGAGKTITSFDVRREGILIEEVMGRSEEDHFDDLSYIRVSQVDGIVGGADDEGDARLYNYDLECVELLDQGHSNIVNSIEYIQTDKGHLCLTGGFDSRLLFWRIGEGKVIKEIDIQELFKKHQISFTSPPFIYSIHSHKHALYIATESGHLISYPLKDLRKPKYILEASLSRIVQTKVPLFNQSLVLTLSYYQGSVSLFDHTKRVNNVPKFMQKYAVGQHPSCMQCVGNELLVGHSDGNELSFLGVK